MKRLRGGAKGKEWVKRLEGRRSALGCVHVHEQEGEGGRWCEVLQEIGGKMAGSVYL